MKKNNSTATQNYFSSCKKNKSKKLSMLSFPKSSSLLLAFAALTEAGNVNAASKNPYSTTTLTTISCGNWTSTCTPTSSPWGCDI